MRLLGIDFGARRIGLAISDPSGTLARPLGSLRAEDSDRQTLSALVAWIDQLVAEDDGLGLIVFGLPASLDGRETDQTKQVRAFAEALGARVAVPIAFQDERLSSREAETRLAMNERDWRARKKKLDAASAAIILQDYIDRLGTAGEPRS